MKVGLVCPYDWSHPGGVRSHIQGLAAALERAGIGTEIIAPASASEKGIFVTGKPLAVPFNGSVARLCFSRSAARNVRARLDEGDIDLVHLHEPAIPSVSMLALKSAEIPAIATFHASSARSWGYAAARPILQPLLGKLAKRIAVSGAACSLVSRYFPGEYEIIPNGVDVHGWEHAEPDQKIVELRPCVLFVGRPEPRKGLDVLVKAMEIVRTRTGATLAVVGPAANDVPGWAYASGPVDGPKLRSIMKGASVFCAPSLGGESFGIVLAEAMAAGVPVVCSDLAGYKEASGGAALHVPAGDPVATANALCSVLSDPSGSKSLVEAGRRRAAELDWLVVANKITEIYEGALS